MGKGEKEREREREREGGREREREGERGKRSSVVHLHKPWYQHPRSIMHARVKYCMLNHDNSYLLTEIQTRVAPTVNEESKRLYIPHTILYSLSVHIDLHLSMHIHVHYFE